MAQDPYGRLQELLFVGNRSSIAALVGLVSFIPESLVKRAILLAEATDDAALRAFLLRSLARRLHTKPERARLRKEAGIQTGLTLRDLTTPSSRQARRLIPQLTKEQCFEVFDRMFQSIEIELGDIKPSATLKKKRTPRGTIRETGESETSTKKRLRRPIVIKKRERYGKGGGEDKYAEIESMPFPASAPDYDDSVAEGEAGDLTTDERFLGGGGRWKLPDFGEYADAEPEPEPEPGWQQDQGDGMSSRRPPDDAAGSAGSEADDKGFESAAPDAEIERSQPPRRDIVNLGFSPKTAADQYFMPDQQLKCGESYYFWLNIGYKLQQAIGEGVEFPVERLPSKARLKVAIFAFEGELEITTGEDVGELRIDGDKVTVTHQPTAKETTWVSSAAPVRLSDHGDPETLKSFLFFPVRSPEVEGTFRLRCNIYCEQLLVQSHVVSAQVRRQPSVIAGALSARMDYSLSDGLRPAHLAAMSSEPHRLSLMINANGDGSAGFRFFGAAGNELVKEDANIDGLQLSGFLKQARGALQKVSWGNEDAWSEKAEDYRYKEPEFDSAKLALDLAYLARAGWRIYSGFRQHLKTTARELDRIMLEPGLVQIALKLSPRAVLPAALVYQYPWRPDEFDFAKTKFELCPTFAEALTNARNGGPALEDCACFHGGCHLKALIDEITRPDSGKVLSDLPPMICPSGFWGYRHALGLPLTQDGTNSEVPPTISYKDELTMVSAISTDPEFRKRDPHFERLEHWGQGLVVRQYKGYREVVTRLKQTAKRPHMVYFYCHGGLRVNNLPYLEIGEKDSFDPTDIDGENIDLKETHPLVFINGCHTTALNPEITLDFVSSFVQQVGASGVIGTEITIFEPLAVEFAEECLKRFLGVSPHPAGMPIGKAVRGARLELLKAGNPLGLVYIPFVIASLRMIHEANPN